MRAENSAGQERSSDADRDIGVPYRHGKILDTRPVGGSAVLNLRVVRGVVDQDIHSGYVANGLLKRFVERQEVRNVSDNSDRCSSGATLQLACVSHRLRLREIEQHGRSSGG